MKTNILYCKQMKQSHNYFGCRSLDGISGVPERMTKIALFINFGAATLDVWSNDDNNVADEVARNEKNNVRQKLPKDRPSDALDDDSCVWKYNISNNSRS